MNLPRRIAWHVLAPVDVALNTWLLSKNAFPITVTVGASLRFRFALNLCEMETASASSRKPFGACRTIAVLPVFRRQRCRAACLSHLQRNMQIAVHLNAHIEDAASKRKPHVLDSSTLRLAHQLRIRSRPTVNVRRCDGLHRARIRGWKCGIVLGGQAPFGVLAAA